VVHPLGADDLVLCSGTIRRAPFDVTVRVAAAVGFQGVSIYYDEYLSAQAAGWSDADLRALLADHGIAIAELDGRMDWLPGDTRGPTPAEFIAAAATLGARSITVLEWRGRRIGEIIPFEIAADAFSAVCDRAADHNLLAHIEYFPLSGIPDLGTAYEVIRRAGRANGGVMLDCWHHLRGPDHGRVDAEVPGTSIVAVQVSDIAPSPATDLGEEMMHHRLLPGAGVGDVASLVRELRGRGCTAPLEVEVYSDELAALDPIVAARRAADALRRVVDEAASEPIRAQGHGVDNAPRADPPNRRLEVRDGGRTLP
jgi:sugar phosphate isomerase/epimerase